jgi:anti-sigma factor RsiW
MTCEEALPLLDAHVDRELDLATDREVERHLAGCERCASEIEAIRALKAALRSSEQDLRAPDLLRRKIEHALGSRSQTDRAPAPRNTRWLPSASSIAIPAAIAALLVLVLMPRMFRSNENDFIQREVVAAHVRSTQVNHLMDVASSDKHTVKPWFAGKIDFSPPVTDFQAEGFKLVGGRVDYLDDRAVAALVYQHGPHIINVFVWPSAQSESAPAMLTRSGYNLDHFSHGGMQYWMASDMSADEMQKLAALLAS